MFTNQRPITVETVEVMFLVPWSDVPESRRITFDPNEHFNGLLRQIQKEFIYEELVHLVNKVTLKVNSLFRGNLNSCWSRIGEGYMEDFPDWFSSMRAGR
jgi:hypothetical protein